MPYIEMHIVDALMILYLYTVQRSRPGQCSATLLDAVRHILPILIWIGKCLDSELMLVVWV